MPSSKLEDVVPILDQIHDLCRAGGLNFVFVIEASPGDMRYWVNLKSGEQVSGALFRCVKEFVPGIEGTKIAGDDVAKA